MIRSLISLTAIIFSLNSLNALDVSVTTASFLADKTRYLEVYLQVVGSTTTFDTLSNGQIKAGVETQILLKKNGEIVHAEKFFLRSPEFERVNDFVELRRYVIENGTFQIEASFKDIFDANNQMDVHQEIDVEFDDNQLQQSDIRMLSAIKKEEGETAFHRNGYFLEPLPFNFYHRYNSTLIFYNEVYHSAKALGEDFMVTYSIQKENSGGNADIVDFRHQRLKPLEVNVILAQLDISALPSGNYNFVVEIKDREQNLLSKRSLEFSRSNPMADVMVFEAEQDEVLTWLDTLSEARIEYAMMALEPTLPGQDVVTLNYLLENGKLAYKKNFLYHIWNQRYGAYAEQGFHQYMDVADAINNMFKSGMGYGFETDRGRVYLKYGRPDERIRIEDDQGAFPYEIWYFNKMEETGQTNVRFMFYNPDLATNHFILLTSTCRGERQNPRWELQLYRNSGASQNDNSIDARSVPDDYRRRARQLYEN